MKRIQALEVADHLHPFIADTVFSRSQDDSSQLQGKRLRRPVAGCSRAIAIGRKTLRGERRVARMRISLNGMRKSYGLMRQNSARAIALRFVETRSRLSELYALKRLKVVSR